MATKKNGPYDSAISTRDYNAKIRQGWRDFGVVTLTKAREICERYGNRCYMASALRAPGKWHVMAPPAFGKTNPRKRAVKKTAAKRKNPVRRQWQPYPVRGTSLWLVDVFNVKTGKRIGGVHGKSFASFESARRYSNELNHISGYPAYETRTNPAKKVTRDKWLKLPKGAKSFRVTKSGAVEVRR